MSLTELKSRGDKPTDQEAIRCGWSSRGPAWCVRYAGGDANSGADATAAIYQLANTRRHVSLRVLLRLTAMDVCCGPPSVRPLTV